MSYSPGVSSDWMLELGWLKPYKYTFGFGPGRELHVLGNSQMWSSWYFMLFCSNGGIVCTKLCDNSTCSRNLGFHDMGNQYNMSSINALRIRKGSPVSLKNGIAKKLDMYGNPSSSMVERGYSLAKYAWNATPVLVSVVCWLRVHQAHREVLVLHWQKFGFMVNPLQFLSQMGVYAGGGWIMDVAQEALAGNGLGPVSGALKRMS